MAEWGFPSGQHLIASVDDGTETLVKAPANQRPESALTKQRRRREGGSGTAAVAGEDKHGRAVRII